MSPSKRSDRTLYASITGVLLVAVIALIWASTRQETRRRELSEASMLRAQGVLHIRLDGFFHELVEDLREEAAAVDLPDSSRLAERWFPLLDTHWPILAIRLADEFGNEFALLRDSDAYVVSRTFEGSKDGPPIRMTYSTDRGHAVQRGPWIATEDYDPRERVWFSKALEDTRDEPVWTLRSSDDLRTPLLQLSCLIRSKGQNDPYRIIAFTVDLSRSDWLDVLAARGALSGIMLADDQGRSLLEMDTSNGTGNLVHAALSVWTEAKTKAPYDVELNGRAYRAMMGSYALYGQQLNTGVVLDTEALDSWIAPERIGLISAAFLLTVLIILLLWAWNRKRLSDERIRKQAKRNRSQELKLAKALGEREVLNREVHHRVKNNLQVVSSLLNLQASRLDEGAVKNEFLRGKRRIDTIALVHHKLYGLADLRNVDLSLFFNDLVKALAELFIPQSRTVSHDIDTAGIKTDQDTAIELGIILCELVGNTYQHAFPYATGGHVEIKVRAVEGDLHRLTVKDNGKGLPDGGLQGAGKLGLEIVEALSEQLDGSFHMLTNAGVQFEVLFRMQRGATTLLTEPEPTIED